MACCLAQNYRERIHCSREDQNHHQSPSLAEDYHVTIHRLTGENQNQSPDLAEDYHQCPRGKGHRHQSSKPGLMNQLGREVLSCHWKDHVAMLEHPALY